MIIDTKRLELIPLTAHQLILWTENMKELENELNCTYAAEPMEGEFLTVVKGQISITQNDPENFIWHSFLFLVRKSDRVVVGSADFKSLPNEAHEVEIGYGLGKEFEHHGYMTEAVKGMVDWGLQQENVDSIIAETEIDNIQSQHVLERCGFIKEKQAETLWWRTR